MGIFNRKSGTYHQSLVYTTGGHTPVRDTDKHGNPTESQKVYDQAARDYSDNLKRISGGK